MDKRTDTSSPLEDLATAYRTLFFDLPLAEARLWLGVGSQREVLDAVWTEYDALSHLAAGALGQDALWSAAPESGPVDKKEPR